MHRFGVVDVYALERAAILNALSFEGRTWWCRVCGWKKHTEQCSHCKYEVRWQDSYDSPFNFVFEDLHKVTHKFYPCIRCGFYFDSSRIDS